jgi:hypothetical protein
VYGNTSSPSTLFDVFFQDRVDNIDYGVRIQGTSFSAFEKPFGIPSRINADGSFNFSAVPWTAFTAADACTNCFGTGGAQGDPPVTSGIF